MKKLVFALVLPLALTYSIQAQNAKGLGIKGGLNYSGNGNYYESAVSASEKPDRNLGFHFGAFYKTGGKFFVKPELVYTQTTSAYKQGDFKMQKLDAPLLVGMRIFKFANVFAGPALQYIIDSEFNKIAIKDIKNDFTVGLNVGVGVSFQKIGIDLRYERGLNKNEARFVTNNGLNTSRIDTRPDQLILSLSFSL
ncbi:outer membrane beta-barrel protein [Bizionia sediminis]|uniref:Outer membrane beta-barrel protein n=1 Tax=Bizionia sediminis TaxID=1737064 RepID=A0ABW5KYE3_9FLAO